MALNFLHAIKEARDPRQNTTTQELQRQAHPEQDPVRWRMPPDKDRKNPSNVQESASVSSTHWGAVHSKGRELKSGTVPEPTRHLTSPPKWQTRGTLPFFSANKAQLNSHHRKHEKTLASLDSFFWEALRKPQGSTICQISCFTKAAAKNIKRDVRNQPVEVGTCDLCSRS